MALLALVTACGSSGQGGGTTPDGHAYAEPAVVSDAAPRDAAPDADANAAPWSCTAPPDGGALSAPEAIVAGASNLDGLGLSSEGVVWLANAEAEVQPPTYAQVWLASDPPSLLFNDQSEGGSIAGFGVGGDWYVLSIEHYLAPSLTVAWNVQSGKSVNLAPECFGFRVVDGSRVYALGPLYTQPDVVCCPIVPGACGSLDHARATAIAVDDSRLYALVLGADYSSDGAYTLQAKTKGSDTPLSVIGSGHVVAPHSFPPGYPDDSFYIAAASGNVAWARLPYSHSAPPQRTIYGIVDGGSPRVLVDDPEGVAVFSIGVNAPPVSQMIALDDQYVYWVTDTGKIKRRRLCGGSIEVLATNQQYPMDLEVDDSAIYWISRGSDVPYAVGNIMRIRKLDAPDAGAASDASTDASFDAAPDASLDAPADTTTDAGLD